jgi:hypothetical protein
VAKVVLIGAIPPLMLKTPKNPKGTPIEAISLTVDGLEYRLYPSLVALLRRLHRLSISISCTPMLWPSQFWKDLRTPFYG